MEQKVLSMQGLNAFLSKIFMWMFAGLSVTAITAMVVASTPQLAILIISNPILFIGIIIGEFALVITISKNALKYSYQKTVSLFMLYSFLNGLVFSIYFVAYQESSLVMAFGVTALIFAIMAMYGYVTKTDLSPFRAFLMIGVIGIIVASVINIFLASGTLSYLVSLAGVVIFAGLTAYDLQKMKNLYAFSVSRPDIAEGNLAVTGALTLYLDFINLFLFVLRLVGRRR